MLLILLKASRALHLINDRLQSMCIFYYTGKQFYIQHLLVKIFDSYGDFKYSNLTQPETSLICFNYTLLNRFSKTPEVVVPTKLAKSKGYNRSLETKILVHGYKQSPKSALFVKMKNGNRKLHADSLAYNHENYDSCDLPGSHLIQPAIRKAESHDLFRANTRKPGFRSNL